MIQLCSVEYWAKRKRKKLSCDPMPNKTKIIPCEGCRERKKKCSSGNPCERCTNLGIQCYYIQPVIPPDMDYLEMINNQMTASDVYNLEILVSKMENEITKLRQSQSPKRHERGNSEETDDSASIFSSSTVSLSRYSMSSVNVSPTENLNWKLSIGKHGMRIDTNIDSYVILLQQLEKIRYEYSIPMFRQPAAEPTEDFLRRGVRNTTLRTGLYRATRRCIASIADKKMPEVESIEEYLDNESSRHIALTLLDVYFSCNFLRLVICQKAAFYRLFVNEKDPESSAVVCAVCAFTLTIHCRHAISKIPYTKLVKTSEYFFNRARKLVELQFDDISLETMTAYIFMASYKNSMLRINESKTYLEMAIRIKHLIQDDYIPATEPSNPSKEYVQDREMFKRLHWGIYDAGSFIDFCNNKRGIPVKARRGKGCSGISYGFLESLTLRKYLPVPTPDESPEIARAVIKDSYAKQLQSILNSYLRVIRKPGTGTVPVSLLIETQQHLTDFYYKKIAPEYRLSLDIFEDGLTDEEFQKRLSKDVNCDRSSITLALRFYSSMLSLYEPYLPDIPQNTKMTNSPLTALDSDEEDMFVLSPPELFEPHIDSTESYSHPSVYALRSQEICFRSAVIVVRILEHQILHMDICQIIMPCLMGAWDVHIRNSCLGLSNPDKSGTFLTPRTIRTSREYALRCIGVLRKGYLFNSSEHYLWKHYQKIEKNLFNSLYSGPVYMAPYWEPLESNAW
ncbi:hypothetical protein CLU79DRAFT_244772 [Phycomyces nitens]|nr:hypothetical protein CLU79DRAFT_244772 [Phycomyces nitens]